MRTPPLVALRRRAPRAAHAARAPRARARAQVVAGAGRDAARLVDDFRELVGPADVELARALRPRSLRAQFGASRALNGLHCTDLPEDGELECAFFFSNLSAKLL